MVQGVDCQSMLVHTVYTMKNTQDTTNKAIQIIDGSLLGFALFGTVLIRLFQIAINRETQGSKKDLETLTTHLTDTLA